MRLAAIVLLCSAGFSCSGSVAAQARAPGNDPVTAGRPGFVLHEGRWRLPQEIAYLKRAAALRSRGAPPAPAAVEKVRASPRSRPPAAAAKAKAPAAARKPGPVCRSRLRGTGLLTVRAQQVELLGFDTVTVGVGTGQVRLMLPRTQSISIGTTVGLPLR